MKIVFTLILASLFFTTAYAAAGDALPDVPDIAYHPLRDDVNNNVFTACGANKYQALEPAVDASGDATGAYTNYDETNTEYVSNCQACGKTRFLTKYNLIVATGKWQKESCCRQSENVVCQEMIRAYKAGCTATDASTHDGTNAGANPTGYGKFAECPATTSASR